MNLKEIAEAFIYLCYFANLKNTKKIVGSSIYQTKYSKYLGLYFKHFA